MENFLSKIYYNCKDFPLILILAIKHGKFSTFKKHFMGGLDYVPLSIKSWLAVDSIFIFIQFFS